MNYKDLEEIKKYSSDELLKGEESISDEDKQKEVNNQEFLNFMINESNKWRD